jgi:membrane protease YdiL (CAAX protease family)
MKKVISFLLCFVPFVAFILIQNIVATIYYMVETAARVVTDPGSALNPGRLLTDISTDTALTMRIMVIAELVAIVAFGLFYRYAMKERTADIREIFSFKGFISVVMLFVGFECVVSSLLLLAQTIMPKAMADYAEKIEDMGIGELSLVSTLVAVILAPIAEEIIYRGVTFKLARQFTDKFWAANLFQAIIFGLAHEVTQIILVLMGQGKFTVPIQGIYAFAMGLLLGYIYRKFNSLWATVLAHLSFNFAGTWLVALIYPGEEFPLWKPLVVGCIAIAVIASSMRVIGTDKKTRINEAGFKTKYRMENPPQIVYGESGSAD